MAKTVVKFRDGSEKEYIDHWKDNSWISYSMQPVVGGSLVINIEWLKHPDSVGNILERECYSLDEWRSFHRYENGN